MYVPVNTSFYKMQWKCTMTHDNNLDYYMSIFMRFIVTN